LLKNFKQIYRSDPCNVGNRIIWNFDSTLSQEIFDIPNTETGSMA
jgi:hypothetical protein